MKTHSKIYFIISLTASFSLFSCNDNNSDTIDCSSYDYSDCVTSEPYDGRMYVKLTINDENQKVPISFYKGKIEDNDLFFTDTAENEYYDTLLPIGYYYSVTATYIRNGEKIIAIDGDEIKKSHSNVCDSVCWDVKTGKVNVRLK